MQPQNPASKMQNSVGRRIIQISAGKYFTSVLSKSTAVQLVAKWLVCLVPNYMSLLFVQYFFNELLANLGLPFGTPYMLTKQHEPIKLGFPTKFIMTPSN